MTSFYQTIKGKYGVKTYQETKNTYDWILKAVQKANFKIAKINSRFLFDIGKISCSCSTIEEYVENAYGAVEYSLTSMAIDAYSDKGREIYLSVDSSNQIYISASNRNRLEKMVQLLNDTGLEQSEISDSISVMYIETQYNNAPTINGNNNTINAGGNDKESKIKQWIKAIAQNLLANWIWYLLTAAIAVGATYLATR